MRRINNMAPEEVFTRTIFGLVLIGAAFVPWGRWVSCVLGVLFLLSAYQGVCVTCIFYKKYLSKKSSN